jgi:hypothetical protein
MENFLLVPRLTIFLQKRIKCELLSIAAVKVEINNYRNMRSNINVILLIRKKEQTFSSHVGSTKVYDCCLWILWLLFVF